MVMIGESRSELLNWLNELLDLNYTKVEQCGTGAAYCQIMDSIFQDIPVSKLNFELQNTAEYKMHTNYKILQSCFVRHRISKPIPVDKLIRCKFQDNLEFLQWIKKFWMENKDESVYDPNARRKGVKGVPRVIDRVQQDSQSPPSQKQQQAVAASGGPMSTSSRLAARSRTSSYGSTISRPGTNDNNGRKVSSSSGHFANGSAAVSSNSSVVALQNQVRTLTETLSHTKKELSAASQDLEDYKIAGDGLETERNFYFNKLREIEILTQSIQELISGNNGNSSSEITVPGLLSQIEEILYSTEEGFQAPDDVESATIGATNDNTINPDAQLSNGHGSDDHQMILDEETF